MRQTFMSTKLGGTMSDESQQNCIYCGKPATVHMTKIVEDHVEKMNLCENCAQAKSNKDPEVYSLNDLLVQAQSLIEHLAKQFQDQTEIIVCNSCKLSYIDFKKEGLLGCPECYEHFDQLLKPLLKNIHKNASHRGKTPKRLLGYINLTQKLNHLKKGLESAIQDERYEDAAELRDRITALNQPQETANIG